MYRLVRGPVPVPPAPVLDPAQEAVVRHAGGPLLVLAGPGTGKTTTLVESVVDRIDRRGLRPDQILVLTFSRRAAADLRARIAARLGRTTVTPMAMTFHALCYALVRRFADRVGPQPTGAGASVRLLTGPEQEFRVRETLLGSLETRRASWPDSLRGAFPTRAFAAEIRAVLARARQLGMDPDDVIAAGEAAGRPEWVSVGTFFDEYLDVLDAEGVLDYAELVHRSRILLAEPDVIDTLRSEISSVFVDEYADTDPAQVSLVHAIAGDGREVVAFGDPDQSIYAFRGAQARGILDFPDRFRTAGGDPAPVRALGVNYRLGKALSAASRNVADRLGLPRTVAPGILADFRRPDAAGRPRGSVEVITCSTAGAEAEHIAEILRGAHVREGLGWDHMAVLVRSGRAMIPGLTRALVAAGVPVEVAGDEIPLAADPAVRPLLLSLQIAARDGSVTPDEAQSLLVSPLGGLDSMAVRRLGRSLRQAERVELGGTALPRPSTELTALALTDPDRLAECAPGPEVQAAQRLADLLVRCRQGIRDRNSAEESLWLLWSGTDWPERLKADAARGGEVGRRANRDLDAICALFDIAARSEEVAGRRGITAFLSEVESQQIPADPMRESDRRGGAVRLLTAHRSKGLEWELVVVAGVQEGSWPDVRRRGSLLEPDRLGTTGVMSGPGPTAGRIAEERRLFYVACTRARRRLVVTAVAGTEGEGDQPSRFLAELGVPIRSQPGRPRRPLTLTALVGELRRVSVDPDVSPAVRDQAATRLARLADATDADGRSLVPGARPEQWWGLRELSRADRPFVVREDPIRLSGSQLAGVLACPRQWFLSRQAAGESARSAAASFGSVVHVLADHAARSGAELDELAAHLEPVWQQLTFEANWLSAVERAEAESALERYVAWQQDRPGQQLLGTEVEFRCEIDLGDDCVQLTGTADRIERDPDGRIRVVDFKTGKTVPTAAEVAQHEQLGVYQLAVQQGAFAAVAGDGARPAGAELVYLRLPDSSGSRPRVFQQASLEDVPFPAAEVSDQATSPEGHPTRPPGSTWVHGRLAEAAAIVRAERHEARLGPACRYCPFRGSCPAQPSGQQVVR